MKLGNYLPDMFKVHSNNILNNVYIYDYDKNIFV